MPVEHAPVGANGDQSVVQGRSAEATVELMDSQHHDRTVALGCLPDRTEIVSVEIYRILQQASVDLAGEVVVVRVPGT